MIAVYIYVGLIFVAFVIAAIFCVSRSSFKRGVEQGKRQAIQDSCPHQQRPVKSIYAHRF